MPGEFQIMFGFRAVAFFLKQLKVIIQLPFNSGTF